MTKKYKSYKLNFIAATDTEPQRMRILDETTNNRIFISCPWKDPIAKARLYLFKKYKIIIKAMIEKGDEVYLLSDDFSKSL